MGPATPGADDRDVPLMATTFMRLSSPLSGRIAAIILGVACVQGCVPVLAVAEAILSGLGDDASSTTAPGPFDGAPSSSQNRDPSDPAITDALVASEFERVTDACKAKLPQAEPEPTVGCEIRLACLPGAATPMKLRLCAKSPETTVRPVLSKPYGQTWAWDISDRAETARAGNNQDPLSATAN